MAINDDITWRLRLDTSEAQMAAQQQLANQQQIMQSIAQMQAMNTNMGAMPYANQMSAQGTIARQIMNTDMGASGAQGLFAPGMRGLYGENLISYSQRGAYQASTFVPPSGILERPLDVNYRPGLIQGSKDYLGYELAAPIGRAFGLDEAGTPGNALPLDQSLTRSQQIFATSRGRTSAEFHNLIHEKIIPGGMMAGALAATVLGGPMFAPLQAVGLAYEAYVGEQARRRDDYIAMGDYFGDATASTFREMRGGGASYKSKSKFISNIAQQGINDKFLNADDMARIEQVSFDLGLQQSSGDTDKVIKVIDNIRQSVRNLTAVGMKLSETSKTFSQMGSMGISVGEDTTKSTAFLHGMSTQAYMAGMSLEDMMDKGYAASNMFSQQGIALNQGARIHAGNLGLSNSVIATGGLSYDQIQFYGGKEGLANAATQFMEASNRSPLGQMAQMAMLRDSGTRSAMMDGSLDASGVLQKGMGNITPREYLNMLYRKPELTKDLDPTMLGMGQFNLQLKTLRSTMGLKDNETIDPGLVIAAFGEEARPMLNLLENAPESHKFQMQSIMDKAIQANREAQRQAPNIFQSTKKFIENTIAEPFFGKKGADWAAADQELVGGTYDAYLKDLNPNDNSLNFRAGMTRMDRVLSRVEFGSGSAGLDRLDKSVASYMRGQVGDNELISGLVESADKSRRQSFNRVEDFLSNGATGVFQDVSTEEVRSAVERIKNKGVVSSVDEKIIQAAVGKGVLSDQDKADIRRAKDTNSDAAYTSAARSLEGSTNLRNFMSGGFTNIPEVEANKEVSDRMIELSLGDRRKLVSSVGYKSDFQERITELAKGRFGSGIKSYNDVLGLDASKQEQLGIFAKQLTETSGADSGAVERMNNLFGNMNTSGLAGVKKGVLSELQGETNKALESFGGVLGGLAGVSTTGISRVEADFASDTVKVGILQKISSSDKSLKEASASGVLTGMLSGGRLKDVQKLIESGDLQGARALINKSAGSMRAELVGKAKGDASGGLTKLFSTAEASIDGQSPDSGTIRDFLAKEKAFSGAYANEAAVTGVISADQGKSMAMLFGEGSSDQLTQKGLDLIAKAERGEVDGKEVIGLLSGSSKYGDVAKFSKSLLDAKSRGDVNVGQFQKEARAKFSKFAGGLSQAEQKQLDSLISRISSSDVTEAGAVEAVTSLMSNLGSEDTGAAYSKTGGQMTAKGVTGINQESVRIKKQIDLMAEVGSQLTEIPKNLDDSIKSLQSAFGKASEEGTYSNQLFKNTKAMESLRATIDSRGIPKGTN